MFRSLVALSLLVATACAPATSTQTPTPSATTPGTAPATATPPATTAPSASPSPSGTPIVLPASAQVAAAGGGIVWMLVAETHLFRSLDRGATWTERSLPSGAAQLEIAFTSDTTGFALGRGSPATQCQAQTVRLWRTTDGAATWQSLAPAGIADAQCKSDLAFVDAQHGFLSADDPNSAPLIYRTSDGGVTWTASARLHDPPGFTTGPGGVSLAPGPVADFGGALFVSAVGTSGGTAKRYVFRSTDGGATWSFAANAPDAQNALVFLTPTRWIQIGAPGSSMETTDAGASWHAFTTDYQQAAPIAPQIVFGDTSTGYATVRGSLQRTLDGGAHWTALKTPGT